MSGDTNHVPVEDRESTPCEECGEPIFFDTARAYFKSPDERFWHPDCIPEKYREAKS